MKNKEFLAQFSRHLIRSAASLRFEPKIEIPSAPVTAIMAAESAFESEKRHAEEMLRMKPPLQQPTIIPPIDISRIADRQFAIPAPKISPQEMSLRREIETAKQQVIKSITPTLRPQMMMRQMPPAVKPQTFAPAVPAIQKEEIPSFDLGKLNIFMKNPEITSIECNGPDNVIIIKKGTLPINTITVLSNDEINDIIHKFSVATKTEITPIYKASYENLVMTAFISPLIGTRFVLIKTK